MTSLSALFARGTGGLPAAEAIDFATLVPPASPNTCIAAPAEHALHKDIITTALPVDATTAWPILRALGGRFPRTYLHAEYPARRQAAWVVRSALLNFPDLLNAELTDAPDGARLWIYSRSLFGRSDLGVNAIRVRAWIAALTTALRG